MIPPLVCLVLSRLSSRYPTQDGVTCVVVVVVVVVAVVVVVVVVAVVAVVAVVVVVVGRFPMERCQEVRKIKVLVGQLR